MIDDDAQTDWVEQTRAVKDEMARRFRGRPLAEQIRWMRERARELRRRYPPPSAETTPTGT